MSACKTEPFKNNWIVICLLSLMPYRAEEWGGCRLPSSSLAPSLIPINNSTWQQWAPTLAIF